MIQSINNKKIKEYAKLIQKKERDKTNLFLVEGEHMVKEAYNANALQELFILEGIECPIQFNYETVTQQVLNKLSNQNSNSKMIGVCKKLNLKPKKENSILLLDNVQDPGNVGTILRTAHSFGIDCIYMSKGCADIYNPKTIQSSQGALFYIPVIQTDLVEEIKKLQERNIEGDDIVDDEYCFERANIPKDHPARDMQDSLYIDPNRLLRTHTTAIQMVVLEESAPNLPIKVVCPGKVYRRDDDDATHSHQFMQMEGLVIGEKVTLADLKGTLEFMARKLFGQDRQIRFRPSYFPFTEPSVEVDVSCHICNGKGCPTCKGTGWIEILGAGEVHPNVLKMAGYDPEKCSGFAFGVGIERVAMLKYGIDDIRHFYTNDKRFNSTFKRYE
jgi:phenylalanyl-tRNA synthetase alpha subunit